MDVSQTSLLATFRASKRPREGPSVSGSHPSGGDPPRKKLALEDRPRSPSKARGSRRDARDPSRVCEELARKEKEKGKREEARGSRARTDHTSSRSSPPRIRRAPRPQDPSEPSQQLGSAARFGRILTKEVIAEQFSSHLLRSPFLAEQAALEAAVRASAFHGELSHHHAELTAKVRQLEVELGGEKAKVAELEDGIEELKPQLDKMSEEVATLRGDKVCLLEKHRAAEVALEKKAAEADSFRDRLRNAKAKAQSEIEALGREFERLRRGEGVDYKQAIQSPIFSPVFDVLKGMVQGSVRFKLGELYHDFDFSLLDAAFAPEQPTAEQQRASSSLHEGGDRVPSPS